MHQIRFQSVCCIILIVFNVFFSIVERAGKEPENDTIVTDLDMDSVEIER